MITDKTTLKGILTKKIVEIKFIKKDGSERKMRCSLREDIVPEYQKKTDRVKKPSDQILAVWDLDKQAFRSFDVDSVIDYFVMESGYEL